MTKETLIFRAFVEMLRANGPLSSLVATWRIDEGTPGEEWLSTESQGVELDVDSDLESIGLGDNVSYYEQMVVRLLVKLPERGSEARYEFWETLRRAIQFQDAPPSAYLPNDTNVPEATSNWLYMTQAGVTHWAVVQPLRKVASRLTTSQVAEARVSLQFFVDR